MQTATQHQRMGAHDLAFVTRLEIETSHQRPQIGVSPTHLSDRAFEYPVVGLDWPKTPSDRGLRLDQLDLIARAQQPNAAYESRETASDDDNRVHLKRFRSRCRPRGS